MGLIRVFQGLGLRGTMGFGAFWEGRLYKRKEGSKSLGVGSSGFTLSWVWGLEDYMSVRILVGWASMVGSWGFYRALQGLIGF